MLHHVRRREDMSFVPTYEGKSVGFTRCSLVDGAVGSVHMGLGLCKLEDGQIDTHVHSFEESFYVLEGNPVLYLDGHGYVLERGACGVVPVGVSHAWRAEEATSWIDMMAPRPRDSAEGSSDDTYFLGACPRSGAVVLDVRDPRTRNLFRLDDWQMNVDNLKIGAPIDQPTVSASMATALLAYSGIAVKMLVDQRLDAHLHTMFMVDYQPGGVAQPHDHPFEESYYMLDRRDRVRRRRQDATRCGRAIAAGQAWGVSHAFYNTSGARCCGSRHRRPALRTDTPTASSRDWDYLATRLSAEPDEARDSMSDRPRVGFVGLGRMGAPMARRVLAAGYPMT